MEMDFAKCLFLSVKQQKILWQMFNNSEKINYKEQCVYRSERAFNRAMNILFEADAVSISINEDYYNEYLLTKAGKFLCKSKIIPLKIK